MATTTIDGLDGLRAAVGQDLGTSDWLEITQDRVNTFADATGDHQWIHVDVERANAESPFGGPIAHGYLTLALTNQLMPEVVRVTGVSSGLNYGVNKVRFPTAVPVGSRIRAHVKLEAAEEVTGGVQTTMLITVELEGSEKPACIVEALSRWLA
ncbi:MAG: MaoC family dehydratase [Acidimicrobiales bacterium]|nr:MaoC family dehydratase [Acidimicrobiales bacterium]